MPVVMAYGLNKRPVVPPEIWLLVFEHATALHTFFESYCTNGFIWSPFDDSNEGSITFDAHQVYTNHRQTIQSIQLVCRQWNTLADSIGIGYRHVVIRSLKQLKSLVTLLEHATFRARKATRSSRLQQGPLVDIGRHITHVKMVNMPPVTTREAEEAFAALPCGLLTGWEVRCLDGGLSRSFISYFRRFLACCPNIQVILDSTSHWDNEQSLPFLGAIHPYITRRKSTALRALEYTQGSPSLSDLYANPQVANSLTRLRGLTLHFAPESSTHGEPLNLPNLTSLDMFLSPFHHIHWLNASKTLLLPSLTHLTVRAPYSAVPFIGAQAMISLRKFLAAYGVGLESLELIVGNAPADDVRVASPSSAVRPRSWIEDNVYDVPALLGLCPVLEELILDRRLIDHPILAQTEALHRRWNHQTLRRVGIRGSPINPLLANIAFARTFERGGGSPNEEVTLPWWRVMKSSSSSSSRPKYMEMCDICRRMDGYDPTAAAAAAEDVMTRTLAILLGSATETTGSASSNSFTSDEDSLTLPKAVSMRKNRYSYSSSLTEIYLLPPPPNASRGVQDKIEMRPCCLRAAPSYEAAYAWRDQCRAEGVALHFIL